MKHTGFGCFQTIRMKKHPIRAILVNREKDTKSFNIFLAVVFLIVILLFILFFLVLFLDWNKQKTVCATVIDYLFIIILN
jgi:hypothetical protein